MILRKKQRVFWLTLGICLLASSVWQMNQGAHFGATLLLNISRLGSQQTSDYTYDGFYRLQADERFADTVVRWLGSPRVSEDILREAEIDTKAYGTNALARFFNAGRLSSQVIRVEYSVGSEISAEKIARAVGVVLNRYVDELNRDAKDPSWFVVAGSEPVIRDATVPFWKVFSIASAVGIFFGFWFAMFAHYWEKQKGKRLGDRD